MNDTQLHAAPAVTDEPEIERMASEIARMASDLAGESDGAAHFQVNKASRDLPGRILVGQSADALML